MNSVPSKIIYWHDGSECCDKIWEAAYRRFETPLQELKKFQKRLTQLGLSAWDKDLDVVELFCGQGTGLIALEKMGFKSISGVDLSPHLLEQYQGAAKLYVGDCRDLKFDNSRDVLIVQGGLHHLPVLLPTDLEQTLQ
ncbi:class I SAM-dependent methyltransferase [Gimesia sp.]|uniref:class I SAM-dependent methyltransferase n=1 Tax=Gimesia sp. TaxID=2024833 RepID=UPI0025BB8DA2|nr:class I SAM-dependent methyltransferase [Gimesia sp.]